ncbi:hypothetical protein [Arthrobacter sp. H14]|uniref:hypothetical protein n=1 Tax=Arthrobacter sp. H14 TaxID=1312959 RepID=UPI00047B64E2|nr:hypothetical protein [Arthrobacter sp. H14]
MNQLTIGTTVDVYASEGHSRPHVLQGQAVIVGYARNQCYVVKEPNFGTTWHRHASEVRIAGQTMPADWHPLKAGR